MGITRPGRGLGGRRRSGGALLGASEIGESRQVGFGLVPNLLKLRSRLRSQRPLTPRNMVWSVDGLRIFSTSGVVVVVAVALPFFIVLNHHDFHSYWLHDCML